MKKGLLSICALIALTIGVGCSSGTKDTKGKWNLVWEENFDQKDHFDEQYWSKIPRQSPDWAKYMSDFDSCYAMKDGNLVLRGLINYSLPNDTAPYITGGIYTKGKIAFNNGRIDIRAKLHKATGAWPAFWLLPEKGGWPEAGEIDIMERLNGDSIAYQTVHSHFTYDLGIRDPMHGAIGKIDPDDYNVYSVEMYRDSLVFFINDIHTFSYPRIETDKEGQFPFSEGEFYLLLDMQLGGRWVGAVEPNDLPVQMEIDWVRFSKKQE